MTETKDIKQYIIRTFSQPKAKQGRVNVRFIFGGPIKGWNLWRFIIMVILMGLWLIALSNQADGFATFANGMLKHDFPNGLGYIFIVLLPLAEIVSIILLVIPRTNHYGFLLSAAMLFTFTGYIAAVLFAGWATFQCGCSKFYREWTWVTHFWFNLGFLLLAITGLFLSLRIRKRGSGAEDTAAKGGSAKKTYKSIFFNIKSLKNEKGV